MITQQDVEDSLRLGRESRAFEVKAPGSMTDSQYVARVARAVMAMANLRDGGQVCLGIDAANTIDLRAGLLEVMDSANINDILLLEVRGLIGVQA